MMVSSRVSLHFINKSRLHQLLAVFLTVIWLSGSTALIQLTREIGENVTISCPVERQKIKFFYLQKAQVFVNGFHASKKIEKKWENTNVVRGNATVQMLHLNASHNGDYDCHIQYDGRENVSSTVIHLSVTARYSKPKITMSCDDNICLVTCASHGGYPLANLTWNDVDHNSSQWWKVLNVSEERDPDTWLYNTSSTSSFNCSDVKKRQISCCVFQRILLTFPFRLGSGLGLELESSPCWGLHWFYWCGNVKKKTKTKKLGTQKKTFPSNKAKEQRLYVCELRPSRLQSGSLWYPIMPSSSSVAL
uniref:programmed cell death 1 ligand 1 isoform X1 n=1 Tax=Doryrhamphus excisus TaxID=161450 RepID=UPI0025AE78B6|nr:programmed cell death 1 ligand 1 isoform X1 [Doryrhamphus excisus]